MGLLSNPNLTIPPNFLFKISAQILVFKFFPIFSLIFCLKIFPSSFFAPPIPPSPFPAIHLKSLQMSTTGTQDAKIVVIEYERLLQPYDDELDALVEEAYGPNGLGVLAVANAPGYLELRNNLLPMGYQFGQLPEEIKARYVHNESNYSFGWSHGKERLAGGKPDIAKGSYYANPQYNEISM